MRSPFSEHKIDCSDLMCLERHSLCVTRCSHYDVVKTHLMNWAVSALQAIMLYGESIKAICNEVSPKHAADHN